MNGIIILNKEENITSFFACNKVKRLLSVKKAGHSGTLDPMATGVLTIALSSATRFLPLLPEHNKSYRATARLGLTTDTLDITGNILEKNEVNVTLPQLLSVAEEFKGEIEQIPPMYSALSKDGKKLYELARQGIEVEREPRKATVFSFEITDFKTDEFTLKVECSSGTYVRTLIDDIGKRLGCGAVMTALERTVANGFDISQSHTLAEIEKAVKDGNAQDLIIPVDQCFKDFPSVCVTNAQATRFSNGGVLFLDRLKGITKDGVYRVYSPENRFLGLGETDKEQNLLIIKRILTDE